MSGRGTLAVRLGAMGDILHALPAVASLKLSFEDRPVYWAMARKWMPLVEGNPFVDEVVPVERSGLTGMRATWRRLRAIRPERAVDFQGLMQSAVVARLSRPEAVYGFARDAVRERAAAYLYTETVCPWAGHVVDMNLELAEFAGARQVTRESWIPPGREEGHLPERPFVLTNPFAGWMSKQWPLAHFERAGEMLAQEGLDLVANVPANRAGELAGLKFVQVHCSSLAGLIAATRRAAAVLGFDSGPTHLAAALRKPGIAIFGPTDPVRNGPYGGTMTVLRKGGFGTTYKRDSQIHPSMMAVSPGEAVEALCAAVAGAKTVRVAG